MRKRKTEISASHEKIMKEKFPFSFHMQDKMYISGLSNLDRKYPPGDSDILLQLQNLRGCLSAAYIQSFFALKRYITGSILQKKYLAYSDGFSGINGAHVVIYSIIAGFRISSFQNFSVLGSLQGEVYKCTGLGIAGVCIVVVDHQTGISAVVLGNRKLFETDGEFVSCNINGCTCALSRGRAAWGGRILRSGRTAICAVIRKLG